MSTSAVDFSVTGDSRKAVGELNKIVAAQGKVIEGLKKTTKQSNRVAQSSTTMRKESNEAFGTGAQQKIKDYVLGLGTVTVAVAAVKKGLADLRAAQEKAAQGAKETEFTAARFAQLAMGDPKRMQQLVNWSEQLRGEFGLAKQQAQELVFVLTSAELEKKREFFAGLFPMMDPVEAARAVKLMRSAMGKEEVGEAEAVVAKLLKASALALTTVEEFAPAAAQAAPAAQLIGASDQELLAFLAHLSNIMPAQEAATAISSLSFAVQKLAGEARERGDVELAERLMTGGLTQAILAIQEMGMRPEELKAALGRKEAAKAFLLARRMLPEVAATQAELGAVEKMKGRDIALGMKAVTGAIPGLAEAEALRKEKVRTEQLLEGVGEIEELQRQISTEILEQERLKGGFVKGTVITALQAVAPTLSRVGLMPEFLAPGKAVTERAERARRAGALEFPGAGAGDVAAREVAAAMASATLAGQKAMQTRPAGGRGGQILMGEGPGTGVPVTVPEEMSKRAKFDVNIVSDETLGQLFGRNTGVE